MESINKPEWRSLDFEPRRRIVEYNMLASGIKYQNEILQQNNNVKDPGDRIVAAFYSSPNKEDQCELCRFMDRHTIDIKHPDFAKYNPPVHPNCYCDWVYIYEEMEKRNWHINWVSPPEELHKKAIDCWTIWDPDDEIIFNSSHIIKLNHKPFKLLNNCPRCGEMLKECATVCPFCKLMLY